MVSSSGMRFDGMPSNPNPINASTVSPFSSSDSSPVPQFVQLTLHGDSLAAKDSDSFGHSFPQAPSYNSTIITFQNIGPQRRAAFMSMSKHNSRQFVKSNASVALFAEHCLNESKLLPCDLFNRRMKNVSPSSFSYLANNKHEASACSWLQPGGTGFSIDQLFSSHKIAHGADPSGLGRWTFVKFQGRDGYTVTMFSAYCPVENDRDLGSVWNQQYRYFQAAENLFSPNPCILFHRDLTAALQVCLGAGDQVIVGIDQNADVRTDGLSFELQALGFREAILTLHTQSSPPATHNRNTTRTPIDAIWVSENVDVLRAGYCPFGGAYGMESDHRMLWIEVCNCSLMGKHLPPPVSFSHSKLQSSHPHLRQRYFKRVRHSFLKAGVFSLQAKLEHLLAQFQSGDISVRADLITTYEVLHETSTSLRLSVEQNLCHTRAGLVPWSPKLQVYRDTIDFWRRVVKLRQGVSTSHTVLKRLACKLSLYKGEHSDLSSAILHLKQAYKQYRAVKRLAPSWRDSFNQGLVDALLAEGKPHNQNASQIRARMRRERLQRELGLAARSIRGRVNKSAVLRAIAVGHDGVEQVLESQSTMVPAMAESNVRRQQQCIGTPSMTSSFIADFGYLGTAHASAQVLDGTYIPPPATDKYLSEFLSCLKVPDSILSLPPFDYSVCPADNAAAWKRQRERTASEPSCLSFAHHKAFALDPQLNKFDTLLRSVPLIVGFSPSAWQVITDVEIFKKPGEYRVDKMRLIQLMSPEFQINNKMIGRRILAYAERANAVATDQHGSRKHHKAINTCLNKKLICDVLRQKRRSGAVAMNDAKGCYDRISHNNFATRDFVRRSDVPVLKTRRFLHNFPL